jgi:hypothetical protein
MSCKALIAALTLVVGACLAGPDAADAGVGVHVGRAPGCGVPQAPVYQAPGCAQPAPIYAPAPVPVPQVQYQAPSTVVRTPDTTVEVPGQTIQLPPTQVVVPGQDVVVPGQTYTAPAAPLYAPPCVPGYAAPGCPPALNVDVDVPRPLFRPLRGWRQRRSKHLGMEEEVGHTTFYDSKECDCEGECDCCKKHKHDEEGSIA